MLTPVSLTTILETVLDRTGSSGIEYRIVGSAATVLYGVEIEANDLDILLRTRSAVDTISRLLEGFTCVQAPLVLTENTGDRELVSRGVSEHGLDMVDESGLVAQLLA